MHLYIPIVTATNNTMPVSVATQIKCYVFVWCAWRQVNQLAIYIDMRWKWSIISTKEGETAAGLRGWKDRVALNCSEERRRKKYRRLRSVWIRAHYIRNTRSIMRGEVLSCLNRLTFTACSICRCCVRNLRYDNKE